MEKMVVLETRHCPYLSKKQLAEELGYGETSIYKLVKGFEEEVNTGNRYSRYAVAGSRYNYFAIIDYLKYKDYLKNPALKRSVPEFDPGEIADVCGRSVRRIK
mgnify:CR=1 FL=1